MGTTCCSHPTAAAGFKMQWPITENGQELRRICQLVFLVRGIFEKKGDLTWKMVESRTYIFLLTQRKLYTFSTAKIENVVEGTHKELEGPLGFICVLSCFYLHCITNLLNVKGTRFFFKFNYIGRQTSTFRKNYCYLIFFSLRMMVLKQFWRWKVVMVIQQYECP